MAEKARTSAWRPEETERMATKTTSRTNRRTEPEPRLFTLTEAERARRELEPFLVEAMDCRKKLVRPGNRSFRGFRAHHDDGRRDRPVRKTGALRVEHQQLAESLKTALNRILETGCIIKDLDVGLARFSSRALTTKTFISAGSSAKTASVFITGRTKDLPGASRSTRATSAPETSCSSR